MSPNPLSFYGVHEVNENLLTLFQHQIYREFVKYGNGLNIGIYSLNENQMNMELAPIRIIISTPKPMAKLIRRQEIPFNQFSD